MIHTKSISFLFTVLTAAAWFVACSASLRNASAENWPRFRGENGTGISHDKGLPKTWDNEDYAWNIELPGEGMSSPIVWENRLFVTASSEQGLTRTLMCIDTEDGRELWSRSSEFEPSQHHIKCGWATSTPATDGERVYATFADKDRYIVLAYDFDGRPVWEKNLGPYESQHGQGASPVIVDDLLIVPFDHDGPCSVVALNGATGDVVWTSEQRGRGASYPTPFLLQVAGHAPQLICPSMAMGIASLDPSSGKLNWKSGGMPGRPVGSPVYDGKAIVQQSGIGGVGAYLIAVDPFEMEKKQVPKTLYTRTKSLPHVPTPIAFEGHLYLWNDKGIVNCLEAATGENIWTKRVGGNYTGSPICVDGTLYIISDDGKVVVLAASPTFEKYGEASLDDPSHSTPACANGRLYFRTFHRLACLPAKPESPKE